LYEGEIHGNIAPVPADFGNRAPAVHVKNADFTMMRFTFDMDMTRLSVAETDLIYDILLSGYNSKFFIEMSEKRGLFYDVNGATERYKNIGTFTFSFEVRPDAVYEATETTLSILSELKNSLLPPDECMKAGYVDNAFMLYDDTRELNFTFAYDNHVMDNGYSSLSERAERYRKITSERLRDAAREIFKTKNLTLTMKGNKKKINTEKILEIINKFD
jgi:predicted Zn-dependent peptidase